MGQIFEWLISNARIAYPFMERIEAPPGFEQAIVDAYIVYDQTRSKQLPVQLIEIRCITNTTDGSSSSSSSGFVRECSLCDRVDVRLTFSDDTLLFDSETADYSCSAFGPWEVLQWVTDDVLVKLVVDPIRMAEFLEEGSSSSSSTEVSSSSSSSTTPEPDVRSLLITGAMFVPRCVDVRPNRITSIHDLFNVIEGRDVDLVAGYNVTIEEVTPVVTTAEPKPKTQLRVSAVPGSGLGRYPGCEGIIEEIKTINGQGPDSDGNLSLEPKGCYWIERPYSVVPGHEQPPDRRVIVDPSSIKLHNDCSPCCTCEDYVAVHNAMRRVWFYAYEAGENSELVRQSYNTAVDRWKEETQCRRGVYSFLQLTMKAGWYGGITAGVRNNTSCTIGPPILMHFTIQRVEPGAHMVIQYVPGSGWLTTDGQPHYQMDTIDSAEILLDSSSSALPTASIFQFEAKHATIPAGRHAVFRLEFFVRDTAARKDNEMMLVTGEFQLGGGDLSDNMIELESIDTGRLLVPLRRT